MNNPTRNGHSTIDFEHQNIDPWGPAPERPPLAEPTVSPEYSAALECVVGNPGDVERDVRAAQSKVIHAADGPSNTKPHQNPGPVVFSEAPLGPRT